MRIKLFSWLVIIISILAVAYLFFTIDLWAGQWKDLFFYLDDWRMWIVVFFIVWLIKKVVEWVLITEVRLLK
ncbi:Uncharacterised protein [uncultured archaeon]|nr:Uncharacterised protein [uncultured archaeon]